MQTTLSKPQHFRNVALFDRISAQYGTQTVAQFGDVSLRKVRLLSEIDIRQGYSALFKNTVSSQGMGGLKPPQETLDPEGVRLDHDFNAVYKSEKRSFGRFDPVVREMGDVHEDILSIESSGDADLLFGAIIEPSLERWSQGDYRSDLVGDLIGEMNRMSPEEFQKVKPSLQKKFAENARQEGEIHDTLEQIFSGLESGEKKASTLRSYLYRDDEGLGLSRFSSAQLAEICQAARRQGMGNIVVEMVLNSDNPHFVGNPEVFESFIKCVATSEDYANPHLIDSAALLAKRNFPERYGTFTASAFVARHKALYAVKLINARIEEKESPHPETRANRLKAEEEFERYHQDGSEELFEVFRKENEIAVHDYGQAFNIDPSSAAGRAWMHAMLDGTVYNSSYADTVQHAARLTYACTDLEGGIDSKNFATARARFEAGLFSDEVSGTELSRNQTALLARCSSANNIANALSTLSRIREHMPSENLKRGVLDETIGILNHLSSMTPAERHNYVEKYGKRNKDDVADELRQRYTTNTRTVMQIRDHSYNTKGLNRNLFQGNVRLKGQLTDRLISPADMEIVKEIVDSPIEELSWVNPSLAGDSRSLSQIEEFDDANPIFDALARGFARVEENETENPSSTVRDKYDVAEQKALELLTGVEDKEQRKALKHTRTALFDKFKTGGGDCRHVANLKQRLFDAWNGRRIMRAVEQLEALPDVRRHHAEREQLKEKIRRWESEELRTTNVYLHYEADTRETISGTKVQIKDGRFVVSDAEKKPVDEPHETTVMVRGDRLHFYDGFYQNTFPLKDVSVPLSAVQFRSNGGTEPTALLELDAVDGAGNPTKMSVSFSIAAFSRIVKDRYTPTAFGGLMGAPTTPVRSVSELRTQLEACQEGFAKHLRT
ncbi:MAG: hypothetical protein KDK48_01205 [Chlamydiia bacterium]|nr:hypothetical protein [Chlamydiia bacterium]